MMASYPNITWRRTVDGYSRPVVLPSEIPVEALANMADRGMPVVEVAYWHGCTIGEVLEACRFAQAWWTRPQGWQCYATRRTEAP